MEPLVGDLIFVRGDRDLVGKAIDWAENGIYSHVAIYVSNGRILEAQGGRRTGWGTLAQYEGSYDIGHIKYASSIQRNRAFLFAKSKIGTRYAWRAILVLALRLVLHLKVPYTQHFKDFVCSFYAADAWASAGKTLTEIMDPTPQDLANSPELWIEKKAIRPSRDD